MERFKYSPSDLFSIFERVHKIVLRAYNQNPREIGSNRLFHRLFPNIKDHSWRRSSIDTDHYYDVVSPKNLRVIAKRNATKFLVNGVHILTLHQEKDHYIEDSIAMYVNQWIEQVIKELVTQELYYAEIDNKKKQEAVNGLYE